MTNNKYRLSLKYRLMFYLAGCIFATSSYILGLWAYGLESASWGDAQIYQLLINNLRVAFQSHMLTLFIWELICTGISVAIGFLFDREVYYRRKAEQKANVDGLTDLYNHRYFQDRLSAEIERANRYGRVFSLIMMDLDSFKLYNDTWGHQEGDKLLKWFAAVAGKCVRSIDVLARYGGEEFVVILPETGASEALAVAERIRETVEKESLTYFGKNKGITISAGVASYPEHGKNRHSLILNSDAALYYAKQQGKNRCFIYEEQCHRSYRATTAHMKALLNVDDMGAIEALGAAVDARDSHMKGHSTAVMQFAVGLAECIDMSAEEIDNLRTASLLHDIGKIGTPEEILEKPGPLANDEWKQIENHADLGSKILKRVQQMGAIEPGVKYHHERYDGKGYPSGLAGKNIPLMARIIAIADAFDAMTNTRSYKQAMSFDDAIDELKRCAGTQFDPDLVDAFIAHVEELHKAKDEKAA